MHLLKLYSNDFCDDFCVKSSKKSRTHLVTIDKEDETVICDCEDFRYRKENLRFGGVKLSDTENHCKHIQFALKIRDVLKEVIENE